MTRQTLQIRAVTGSLEPPPKLAPEQLRVLEELPLLRFLSPEVRAVVAASFVPATFAFGAPIVREGEPADALFVLASGRARVVKTGDGGEELSLGALRPG